MHGDVIDAQSCGVCAIHEIKQPPFSTIGDGGCADAQSGLEQFRPCGDGGIAVGIDVAHADGEIWLQTFPRVCGYTFKPVSFWYCHRADGALAAIVAEVHNTFGERHCYLLDAPHWGHTEVASKVFHVSPFCAVQGDYRFRFMRHADHTVARVDHDDDTGPLLQTSISGQLQPLSAASAPA